MKIKYQTTQNQINMSVSKINIYLGSSNSGKSEAIKTLREKLFNDNKQSLVIVNPENGLTPEEQVKWTEEFFDLKMIHENRCYLFIETHSEYIVRKLQVMVKQGILSSDDISIHYFKKDDNDIVYQSEHKINSETGKLRPNFPKGFYDVSYDLGFQLMD